MTDHGRGEERRRSRNGDPRVAATREVESNGRRPVLYCTLPARLAPELHDLLRRHFRDDPRVEVVVERRSGDRRSGADRRQAEAVAPSGERRRIRATAGRRIAQRRAVAIAVDPPALPRRARRHADAIVFVERLEPSTQEAEDIDSARLVARFQTGDRDAFTHLYTRYFDRIYGYLRAILRSADEAEEMTQQVLVSVYEALPRYERRGQPFRAWLFTIVRNQALTRISKRAKVELRDPHRLSEERREATATPNQLNALEWLKDRDLMILIERLPVAQRQVLTLRFMLELSGEETARVLDLSNENVRTLQHRALRFLEHRLTALGRAPARRRGSVGMLRDIKPHNVLRARRFALRG